MRQPINSLEALDVINAGEEIIGESLTVDQKVDTIRQIQMKMARGAELPYIGKRVYHDENDEFEIDITLNPDFDLADVTAIEKNIRENTRKKEHLEKLVKAKQDALKKAQDEQKAKEDKAKAFQNNQGVITENEP